MRKKYLIIIIMPVVIVLFAACNQPTGATEESSDWTEGQVVILNEASDFGTTVIARVWSEDIPGIEAQVSPTWAEGHEGQGLDLGSHVNTHIRLPPSENSANFDFSSSGLTLNTWILWKGAGLDTVNPDTVHPDDGGQWIWCLSGPSELGGGFVKVCINDGSPGLASATGSYNGETKLEPGADFPVNKWVMVTFTLNGTKQALYLNGEKLGEAAQPMIVSALQIDLFRLGKPWMKTPSLNAIVDQTSYWKTPLSEEAIKDMYEATK
jgi:hypothetical protein